MELVLIVVPYVAWVMAMAMAWVAAREGHKQRRECRHWKQEACTHLERERAAMRQAECFERVSRTMEEHCAAERGRAERLEAALRESEDKAERLGEELDRMRRAGKPAPGIDAREFANLMNYNGTSEGQVNLTDAE